jgi:excisionase family DNA binding protein
MPASRQEPMRIASPQPAPSPEVADRPGAAPEAHPASADESIRLGEAAQLLGVSSSTLRRWADEGRVATLRSSGGHRRFTVAELQRMHGLRRVRLRTPPMPSGTLHSVYLVLISQGSELADMVAGSLYEGRDGWFAQDEARAPTAEWITQLATSFRQARYGSMTTDLARYMRRAEVSGASLAERHLFVERFGAATRRRLEQQRCPAEEQRAAAQAMAALALHTLPRD